MPEKSTPTEAPRPPATERNPTHVADLWIRIAPHGPVRGVLGTKWLVRRADDKPFVDNPLPIVPPIVNSTSATEAATLDRHLVNGNTSTIARAHIQDCQPCPPVQPCPPAPAMPAVPPAPSAPTSEQPTPSNQLPTPSGQLPSTEPSAQTPAALQTALNLGGSEPGLGFGNAPSIIGDFFSGHGTQIVTLEEPSHAISQFGNGFSAAIQYLKSAPSGPNVSFTFPGGTNFLPSGVSLPPFTLTSVSTSAAIDGPSTFPFTNPQPQAWTNTPATTTFPTYPFEIVGGSQAMATFDKTADFSKLLQSLDYNALSILNGVGVSKPNGFFVIPGLFTTADGTYKPQASLGLASGPPGSTITDPANQFILVSQQTFIPLVKVALPSAATAGQDKFADNTSPIPRDRIIFDYSFFDQVPLTPNGVDVDRFVVGFEKTLFRDDISLEVRLPFATTLSEDIFIGANGGLAQTNTNAVEVGNLTAYLKTLPWHSETWAIGVGIGLQAPTVPDLVVSQSNGQQLYEIKNREFDLLPYVGAVWTPNPRFFLTQIGQLDIDLNPNPVVINQDPNHYFSSSGSPDNAGGLKDPPFFFYDVSAGYWLLREPAGSSRFLTGLAAIFEVHYNQSLGGFGSVSAPMIDQAGNPLLVPTLAGGLNGTTGFPNVLTPIDLQIGGGGAYTSVDLTLGFTAEIRDNAYFSVGCAVPVTGGIGHEYDYEIRANFSYYFGRSAKDYRVGVASAPSTL